MAWGLTLLHRLGVIESRIKVKKELSLNLASKIVLGQLFVMFS